PAPTSPLCPYTTLFRSNEPDKSAFCDHRVACAYPVHAALVDKEGAERIVRGSSYHRAGLGKFHSRAYFRQLHHLPEVLVLLLYLDRKSTRLNSSHVSIS